MNPKKDLYIYWLGGRKSKPMKAQKELQLKKLKLISPISTIKNKGISEKCFHGSPPFAFCQIFSWFFSRCECIESIDILQVLNLTELELNRVDIRVGLSGALYFMDGSPQAVRQLRSLVSQVPICNKSFYFFLFFFFLFIG